MDWKPPQRLMAERNLKGPTPAMTKGQNRKEQTKPTIRTKELFKSSHSATYEQCTNDNLHGQWDDKWRPHARSRCNRNERDTFGNIKLVMDGSDSNLPPHSSTSKTQPQNDEKPARSDDNQTGLSSSKTRMLPAVEKPNFVPQSELAKGADLQQKLRDFKSGKNLNSLRALLKGLPGRPASAPDGRGSVDSAFYDHSREGSFVEEARQVAVPRPSTAEGNYSTLKDTLSSTGSPTSGKVSPVSRRWGVAVNTVRDRRQKASENTRKKLQELDLLKKSAEDAQVRANRMEAEVEPLREKVKRYEGVIENLEDRLENYKTDLLSKEREKLFEIDKLERKYRNEIDKETRAKEDLEMQLKDDIRRGQTEIKLLKKQLEELTEELESTRDFSSIDDDDHPKSKQLSSMRKELMQVRQLLEDSETERLNERKGKLSTIQTMIKLTKQKADVEEELDEKKKADTRENSDKYMKLAAKLAVTEMKLQKLRQEKGQEVEELQRRYLEEIRDLKKSHESDLAALTKERDEVKKQALGNDIDFRPLSSPRGTNNFEKKAGLWKEIGTTLQGMGLQPGTYTAEEACQQLFVRLQSESDKVSELDDMMKKAAKGDLKAVVDELREEKRVNKRKLEDLQEAVAAKDSQMKVTEMALKRQIEDLLGEKKGAFLQMQKAIDQADSAKEDADKYKTELDDLKALLQKKQTEMNMLQDNLLSVTNEMKTVDADLGKARKELSVKEAELARIKRDIDIEMGLVSQEKDANSRIRTELEQKRMIIKGCEKTIHELEDRVHVLNETVESYRMQTQRLNSERDKLSEELQVARADSAEHVTKAKEADEAMKSLKLQVKSLENTLKEKVDRIAVMSTEFEKNKTELLASQHLLNEEQDKNQALEDEIDGISDELKHKTEETDRLNAKVKDLEDELENIRVELSHTQVSFADTEDSLKSQYSTRSLIEKELRLLQGQFKDLTREKQNIQNAFEDTKQQLQSVTAVKKQLQEDLQEVKWKLNEKILAVNELKAAQERFTETTERLESDLRLAEDKLVVLKREKQELNEENERLKGHVSDLKRTNAQLTEQLKRKREEGDKQGKYQSQRLDLLTRENEELRNQIRNAQSILQEFPELDLFDNDETDSGISTSNHLAAPVGVLIERLRTSERKLREMQMECSQMQGRNEALNAEITRLTEQLNREKINLRQECEKKVKEAQEAADGQRIKHQQTVDSWEQKLREEQRKNLEMESQNNALLRERDLLSEGNSALKEELKSSYEAKNSLQSELSDLQQELRGAKKSESQLMTQVKEENKACKEQLLRTQDGYTKLKAEYDDAMVTMATKLSEKDKRVFELELASKSNEEERARLSQQLKDKDREWQTQTDKMNKMQEDYQALHKESTTTRLKFDCERDALERSLREKEIAVADVKRALELKDLVVAEMQTRVSRLETELGAMDKERHVNENEVFLQKKEIEEEATRLREKVTAMETQNRFLKEHLATVQQARNADLYPLQSSPVLSSNLPGVEMSELKRQMDVDKSELARERKEKREALRCLKALVYDNEALSRCITGLQETVSQQREEVAEASAHLKDVLEKYEHLKEMSFTNQRLWESMAHEKTRHEEDKISELKSENDRLRQDLGDAKKEKDKLQWQYDEKTRELQRMKGELDYSQRVANDHLRRRKDDGFLESQLAYLTSDRNVLTKQMQMLELSNRMLQDKLKESQKWYGNLSTNVLQSKTTSPSTLQKLKESQMSHERFLQSQFELLASKMARQQMSPSHLSP